jgi:Tfp pilus assembly protein PilW
MSTQIYVAVNADCYAVSTSSAFNAVENAVKQWKSIQGVKHTRPRPQDHWVLTYSGNTYDLQRVIHPDHSQPPQLVVKDVEGNPIAVALVDLPPVHSVVVKIRAVTRGEAIANIQNVLDGGDLDWESVD